MTKVVDGNDDGDADFGGDDDPVFEPFSIVDNSNTQTNQTQFVLEYEILNTERFGDPEVTSDNREHDWSAQTRTNTSEPTGK